MITDIRTVPSGTVIEADLCIIGGGPAAILMATQLTGTNLTVAILESGTFTVEPDVRALAAGTQSGIPYFPLDESRVRLLGGSTVKWGARTAPMKPIDFTRRSWVPMSGWPISLDALAPYYDRVFDLVGLYRPFSYDQDVWKSFDRAAPALDPRVLEYTAFQFGKNLLLGEIHRKPLQLATNVTVYLNATALNVQSNARGTHVERVDVGALTGQRYTVKARDYVLACGGMENARLLLLSNTVVPAGLCNEHGLVGRYFMEHPTVPAGRIRSDRGHELHDLFSPGLLGGRLVEVGLALSPEIQRTKECLNAVGRSVPVVTSDSTQALRELVWRFQHRNSERPLTREERLPWVTQRVAAVARDPFGIVMNVLRHAAGKPKRYRAEDVVLEVRAEQEPNPESRVTLSDATDAFGQRRTHLHWAMTARDKHTVRVTAEAIDGELRRLGLGAVEIAPWLRSEELVWPPSLVGGHHHMGTTRMADDPRTGVVDRDGKAHAVDNLFITGSSVFPTAGYVNPTATLLALALRLAEYLQRRRA